ncbi:MAG: hypothetical protein IKC31_05030 [Clostridia bacterium]|nr:hypothetical protein [Clostridia bacterium]
MKRLLCALLILAPCLYGCVHYVPREERQPLPDETAVTTAPVTPDLPIVTEPQKSPEKDPYPNVAQDGYTKRY